MAFSDKTVVTVQKENESQKTWPVLSADFIIPGRTTDLSKSCLSFLHDSQMDIVILTYTSLRIVENSSEV